MTENHPRKPHLKSFISGGEVHIGDSCRKDIREAVGIAGFFRIPAREALERAEGIQEVVRDWEQEAGRCGIPGNGIKMMEDAFAEAYRDIRPGKTKSREERFAEVEAGWNTAREEGKRGPGRRPVKARKKGDR